MKSGFAEARRGHEARSLTTQVHSVLPDIVGDVTEVGGIITRYRHVLGLGYKED